MGSSMGDFKAALPDWQCTPAECRFDAGQCMKDIGPSESPGDRLRGCSDRNSFGGAFVMVGAARFRDDRLVELALTIGEGASTELERAVTARHGKPARSTRQLQNRLGATFTSSEATWKAAGATLLVQERFGRPDQGRVLLTADSERQARARDAAGRAQKKAGDL